MLHRAEQAERGTVRGQGWYFHDRGEKHFQSFHNPAVQPGERMGAAATPILLLHPASAGKSGIGIRQRPVFLFPAKRRGCGHQRLQILLCSSFGAGAA